MTSEDALLSVMGKSGISVYVQYIEQPRETSGLVNYVHDGDVLGHFHFTSTKLMQVGLKNGGKYVSVGILNSNNEAITVEVKFEYTGVSVVIIIVISFLCLFGLVLFIGLIVLVTRVIQKYR